MTTMVALFSSLDHAQQAVGDLVGLGLSRDSISVIVPEQHVGDATSVGESATAGALGGSALGGAIGLLAGLGALAIPGIGPVLAVGPLVSALAGAGAGALGGGAVGALVGAGLPEDQAHSYAEALRRGGTLVAVQSDQAPPLSVKDIFQRNHAVDIEVHAAAWREQGWSKFDPDAEDYVAETLNERDSAEYTPDAPPTEPELPPEDNVGTSIGSLTGGVVPGGYGAAGDAIFGTDKEPRR